MRSIAIIAMAATMLAACATAGNGANGNGNAGVTAGAAAGGKQYCRESRLASAGGRHNCNWSTDKQAACEGDAPFTTVDGSRYTAPRTSAQCGNGRWVVEMAPLG